MYAAGCSWKLLGARIQLKMGNGNVWCLEPTWQLVLIHAVSATTCQVFALWELSAVSWRGWICSTTSMQNHQAGWRARWAGPSTSPSSPSLCRWWQLPCSCGQPGVTARTTPGWWLTGSRKRRSGALLQHCAVLKNSLLSWWPHYMSSVLWKEVNWTKWLLLCYNTLYRKKVISWNH